jgi:DNA-binding transcriptional regulator LsrR (DeoR family)
MAQADLRRAARARRQRDQAEAALVTAIVEAYEAGETLRDIAPHVGLSYTRVHAIIQKARADRNGARPKPMPALG